MSILHELGTVLLVALVLGAGLPALFAVGVRLGNPASGKPSALGRVGAGVIYTVCLAVIIAGVLLITNNTITHYTGINIYGLSGGGH